MRSIILRPLAVFTIAFYVFSCILFTADRSWIIVSAVIFSSLFIISLLIRTFIPIHKEISLKSAAFKAVIFLLAGCATAALVTFFTLEVKIANYHRLCDTRTEIEGTVTDVMWDGNYSGAYIVKVEELHNHPSFYCVLTTNGGIVENTRISASVTFSELEKTSRFDEKTYYLSRNVYLKADAESVEILGEDKLYLTAIARRISYTLSDIFYDTLGKEEGAFASALLLGNTSRLPDTVTRDFRRLGISHVLAISGMHLAILCSFVSALLKRFGKRTVNAGCIVLILFYVFVTGFAPTVIRSGIMVLLPIVAANVHKGADRFTLLGISVFLICIFNPLSALDIGLQLSFAALMAIFLLTENKDSLISEKIDMKAEHTPLKRIRDFIISFFKEVFLSAVIILFMLPLEWLYFKQVCPIAPLIGPVFSVFCNILLWTLPILLLLSPSPTLAGILAYPLKLLIGLTISAAEKISSVENITLSLNYPFAPLFSILIFAAVCAFCVTKNKKRIISAAVSIILIVSFVSFSTVYSCKKADETTIGMLTYKSNDGICMLSQNKAMIIDVGNGYSGILNESEDFLSTSSTTEIEAIMLTHFHNSYKNTLNTFLSRNIVRRILLPYGDHTIADQLEIIIKKHNVKVEYYCPHQEIVFEDIAVIPYESAYIERSVQPIVRFDIIAKGKTFTYVGGAYLESTPDAYFDCDYLFFGGHGPLYKKKFAPDTKNGCSIYCSDIAADFYIGKDEISATHIIVTE